MTNENVTDAVVEETVSDIVDSVEACALLGISKTNLRQLVFRKLLVPTGRHKRRSLFNRSDVMALSVSRSPSIPSV